MQLPVQKALLEDSQPWANEEEDVLEALEAQEDLGSGVDLLAAPEPHLLPVTFAEPVPEVAAPAEVGTEPGDSVVVVETSLAVVEDVPAETVATEATPEDKTVTEPTENEPAPEPEVAVKTEAPAVVEEVTPVSAEVSSENATPSVEIVASEPTEVSVVKEEVAEVISETPAEVAAPVEAPISNAAPATAPATPHESSEPDETASSAPSEPVPLATNEAAAPSTEAALPAPSETAAPAPIEVEVVAMEPSVATTPECAAPGEAAAAAISDAAAQSAAAVPSEAVAPCKAVSPPAEAAVPEPQPGLTAPAEPVPEVAVPAEVCADPEASEGGLEAPPSVENAVPVETVAADLTTEAKPLVEATEKEPAADSIVA